MKKNEKLQSPKLSAKKINKYLSSNDRYKIICFHSLRSTQDALKNLSKAAPDGQVFIADTQIAGRGREGRTFFSPDGSGIYMSILLRPSVSAPSLSPNQTVYITAAVGVAVSEAIENITNKKTGIKWVNDVIYNGLKVSGILTEAVFNSDTNGYDYVIVGIGVNLFKKSFPEELIGVAGALYDKKPLFLNKLKTRLTAEILNRIDRYYGMLSQGDFSFVNRYREKSIVIGKTVDMIVSNKVVGSGLVLSVNDDCTLNVKTENGEISVLSYGEVRIKLNEKQ